MSKFTRINISARLIGTLVFATTGNKVRFWIGTNSNTGHYIVWQRCNGNVTRHTGRNIRRLANEILDVCSSGEANFDIATLNEPALQMFIGTNPKHCDARPQ